MTDFVAPSPDRPSIVKLSDEERETGELTPVNLFVAVDAIFRDGIVVLDNAIEVEYIDALNERMRRDTEELINNQAKIHWNQGRASGNVSQNPPFEKEYMYPQIYANRPAATIMANILGPRPQLRYIRSNTLVGNTTERQIVHKDCQFEHLSHPFFLALNICLVDTSPQNGSTEIWLGTSKIAEYDDIKEGVFGIRPEKLEARRKVRPPIHPELRKGSLVLRDVRTWHAGMPNHTGETRIMLALGYLAKWHGADMVTPVPESLREIISHLEKHNSTDICVTYVPDEKFDNLYSEFKPDSSSAIRPERGSIRTGAKKGWTLGTDEPKYLE